MAAKRGKKPSRSAKGKVGSDLRADREVGGKLDFGIPASKATPPPGGREKGPDQGTGPMRSGATGFRTAGVGHAPGGAGVGSGGDIDPDFIGLDGKGAIAADAPVEHPQNPREAGGQGGG